MRTTRTTTTLRSLALVTATLVATTGLAALAPAAHAVGFDGGSGISWGFGGDGGACTITGDPDDAVSSTVTSAGAGATLTAAKSAALVSTSEPADKATARIASRTTLRATEAGGAFASLTYTASLDARVTATYGVASDCEAEAETGAQAGGSVTVAKAGWISLTSNRSASGLGVLIGSLTGGDTGVIWGGSGAGTSRTRVWVDPGTYSLGFSATVVAAPSDPDSPTRSTIAGTLTATFVAAGGPTTAQAGSGSPYLTLGAARTCATGRLPATFTAKGTKVASAVLSVNGARRLTVKNPKAGAVVQVPGLAPTADAVVTAVLTLDPPKPKKGTKPKPGKKVTLTRTYAACG